MSLPVTADLRTYCRKQTTADDTLFAALVAQATAAVRGILGRPIVAETHTYRQWQRGQRRAYSSPQTLMLKNSPCDWSSLVIKDVDDMTLTDTDDYWTPDDPYSLLIYARQGMTFTNGPYTIEVDCGLSVLDDYLYVIEPVVSRAILDLGADWYQRRLPSASSENAAGGVSHTFSALGIPPRVIEVLGPWIRQRAV